MSKSPKRRIERRRSILSHQISNSAAARILHTCEDSKTLIRILIDGIISSDSTAQDQDDWGAVISLEPGGTPVVSPSYSIALDQDVTLQEITRFVGKIGNQISGTNAPAYYQEFRRDIKAMRKCMKGDEIVWSDVASTASKISISAVIYLWFKE